MSWLRAACLHRETVDCYCKRIERKERGEEGRGEEGGEMKGERRGEER